MFGILYGIYSLLGIGIYKTKEGFRAEGRKQDAIKNNEDTYTDAKGKTRYIKNDRWVSYSKINGHTVLQDVLNDAVYVDYTKRNIKKRQEDNRIEAINQGKTVYLFLDKTEVDKNDKWEGNRYKDINTGKIFVERYDNINVYCEAKNKYKFYVDIETGMYIRKTDGQIKKEKEWKKKQLQDVEQHNEIVLRGMTRRRNISDDEFNKRLKIMIDKSIEKINNHFLDGDKLDEFINKMNDKQKKYKENEDDLYYYGGGICI